MMPHAACWKQLLGSHPTRTPCPPVTTSSTITSLRWLRRWASTSEPVLRWWPSPERGWTKPAAPTGLRPRCWCASQPPMAPRKTWTRRPYWMPQAHGTSPTHWADPACPPPVKPPHLIAARSPHPCLMCWGRTGTGLPTVACSSWVQAIPRPIPYWILPSWPPRLPPPNCTGRSAPPTPAGIQELSVDIVVPATGFRPELAMLQELRLDLDAAVEAPRQLGPLIDAEFHSCGSVAPHGERVLAHPEPGFYIVGSKSYGRAPTFLLATGYEQVRSIAAALAGDRQAADDVHLNLPETGVCTTDLPAPSALTLLPVTATATDCCAS